MTAQHFLLEIGFENLPASYVAPAIEQLRVDAEAMLRESRLEFDEVHTTGTPRRLVLNVIGLAEKQSASEETVTGPPVARAYDEDGTPTKAAEGFARSQGVAVEKLQRIATDRGEYLGITKKLPRRNAHAILRDALVPLITNLRFPKTMKWEPSGTRFARPLRWIVAMVGSRTVKITIAGVTSGTRTYGRPWMRSETRAIRTATGHAGAMKQLGIVLDHHVRRERIRTLAESAARRAGLRLVADDSLLDELTFMLEHPNVIVGRFDDQYLSLPPEVVTTAMRSHQRYFALSNARGKLVARFITFTDHKVTAPAVVRSGNEKVLKARLEDALFYWNEDLKRGMDGLADELDRIVFIEGVGTVGEKCQRIALLAPMVLTGEPVDPLLVARAARLYKADTASEMVKDGKEFTKLQGLIGSYYARAAGEPRAVVAAIREHQQPRTPGESIPKSALGKMISVADRMDTISGCFLMGLIPSGSQDPYALRRQANGMIRIVERLHSVHLDQLVDESIRLYGAVDGTDVTKTQEAVTAFMQARVGAFLKDHGIPYDVADAIIPVSWAQPGVALSVAKEISKRRGDAVFERLITGVKRVGNILDEEHRLIAVPWEQIRAAVVDQAPLRDKIVFQPGLFEDPSEGALHQAMVTSIPLIANAESNHQFGNVLKTLSDLADPIDAFFENVLVNSDNPELRENRHNFLASIYAMFARYADFSAIVDKSA